MGKIAPINVTRWKDHDLRPLKPLKASHDSIDYYCETLIIFFLQNIKILLFKVGLDLCLVLFEVTFAAYK
jgi:hypothetical protein